MSESVSRKSTKKASWRRYQKDSQTNKKILLGIVILSIFAGILMGGKLMGFLGGLKQPFSPDSNATVKHYRWDGTSTINLVVKGNVTYALSFNPDNLTATILKIPDETIMNLPKGFGSWPMRSVYGLGQSESPPIGASLLKDTISTSFGIPVDGYIILDEEMSKKPLEQVIEGIRKNLFSSLSLAQSSKTDLSTLEFFRLIWGLKDVRSDKVKLVDLNTSNITQSILLSDRSRALGIDQVKLDSLIQAKFTDARLSDEGKTIGIFNATTHLGLAEEAARVVSNMGGRVIFTTNAAKPEPKTVVLGEDVYSKKRLTQVFAPTCLSSSIWPISLIRRTVCDITAQDITSSRAEVTIVLGEDFLE